ncbi:MAG: sugar kinase [Massiliimalia sp.]|jgi:2-dehydro-3-deoxygluconokinase
MNSMFDAVSFGEVMLRLTPPDQQKLAFSDSLLKHAGGAELNVLTGISRLGMKTAMLTKLPDHALSQFIRQQMRAAGVDDSFIAVDRDEQARVGLYFYEQGVLPRKPSVVYDRKNSSVNRAVISDFPEELFEKARLFHISGISLAISEACRQVSKQLIQRFRDGGAKISFDVNYRANLWSEEEAYQTITEILPMVDILFISEETSRRMFHKSGKLEDIMKSYCEEYGVSVVGTTRRTVVSPTCHHFGSVIYEADSKTFYTEPDYEGIQVIDRIGSGDAFVAGALYGILCGDCQQAVQYGNAMAALKNTVFGDLPLTDREEVKRIILAHQATGIQSEMDR